MDAPIFIDTYDIINNLEERLPSYFKFPSIVCTSALQLVC